MIKTVKVEIPKIILDIKIIETAENNKKTKPKTESNYYFVTQNDDINSDYCTILTIIDCLTVPIFAWYQIKRKDLTKDTIYGFNDIIPENRIVFGSVKLEEVLSKIHKDQFMINNHLKIYSPFLCRLPLNIDIVNLNKMKVVKSINL